MMKHLIVEKNWKSKDLSWFIQHTCVVVHPISEGTFEDSLIYNENLKDHTCLLLFLSPGCGAPGLL